MVDGLNKTGRSLEKKVLFLLSNFRLEFCMAEKVMSQSPGGPLFFKVKWFLGNIVA
jgi:hypothetical protein